MPSLATYIGTALLNDAWAVVDSNLRNQRERGNPYHPRTPNKNADIGKKAFDNRV